MWSATESSRSTRKKSPRNLSDSGFEKAGSGAPARPSKAGGSPGPPGGVMVVWWVGSEGPVLLSRRELQLPGPLPAPLLPASPFYSAWLRFAVSCPSVEFEPRETQPTCTVSVHSLAKTVAAQELSEKGHLLGRQTLDGKKAIERIDQHDALLPRSLDSGVTQVLHR